MKTEIYPDSRGKQHVSDGVSPSLAEYGPPPTTPDFGSGGLELEHYRTARREANRLINEIVQQVLRRSTFKYSLWGPKNSER